MKMPMVLTSRDRLGNTGSKTGLWREEAAAPYFDFRDTGVEPTLARQGAPRSEERSAGEPDSRNDAV